MVIAVQCRCAESGAVRVVVVAVNTRTAVFRGVVKRCTLVALCTGPLVAAFTVAPNVGVASDAVGLIAAVACHCARQVTMRVRVVACGACSAALLRVVNLWAHIASVVGPLRTAVACAVVVRTRGANGVIVAVLDWGTGSRALWVHDVAIDAGAAVKARVDVLTALRTFGAEPLIPTGAIATLNDIASHAVGMARAVPVGTASLETGRVGGELFVPRGTCTTVLGAIVLDGALVTRGAEPSVPACAGAVREQPGYARSMVVAVLVVRADAWTFWIALEASSALTAGRTSKPRLTGTAAITLSAADIYRMAVAIQNVGAHTRTLGVVDVAGGARSAISSSGVVGCALITDCTFPLVAAGAATNVLHVASNFSGVVRAIGGRCTRLVALWIGGELLVPRSACTTVLGAIVAGSALVASSTSPLVATGAGTVWRKSADVCRVIIAIHVRSADTRTSRVVGVPRSALVAGGTGVVSLAVACTVAFATVD